MGAIFKQPDIQQAVPPPPPSPTSADPNVARETQARMQAAADAERKAKGRASTLLTGGEGVKEDAQVSKRVLLGA